MNVLTYTEQAGCRMNKVSTNKGGEYHGPCPWCGGDDRFHVWPEQRGGEGSYWCRQCGKAGDLLQFIMDYHGVCFREALRRSGKDAHRPTRLAPPRSSSLKKTFLPVKYDHPKDQWQEKAAAFVNFCHNQLLGCREQLSYLESRGVTIETVERFRLGYNPGQNGRDYFRPRESWGLPVEISPKTGKPKKLWIPRGIVIPYIIDGKVVRVRIRRPKKHLRPGENNKYYIVPGSGMSPLMINQDRQAHVIVEAELDAMMIDQAAGDLVGCIAMGSSHTKPDVEVYGALKKSLCIINALDFDKAGAGASDWWEREFPQARRRPVSIGKDPGDLCAEGLSVRQWVLGNLPPAWRLGLVKSGGKNKVAELSTGDNQPQKKIRLPESVVRLGKLLQSAPVWIHCTSDRTTISSSRSWQQKAKFKEISRLVFLDLDCIDFVNRHPYREKLAGWNYFKGIDNAS